MIQALDSKAGTASEVGDYDEICRVVQIFLEGEAKGDIAKLKEAFHEEARMFGSLAGTRYDVHLNDEAFAMFEAMPGDTGSLNQRILSVHQTKDAAIAICAEDGYWGSASFIDYLQLARIDGRWKIVSKLFAHTAGEPPASG